MPLPTKTDLCPLCHVPLETGPNGVQEQAMGHQVDKSDTYHAFHVACILQWNQTHNTCPLCTEQQVFWRAYPLR